MLEAGMVFVDHHFHADFRAGHRLDLGQIRGQGIQGPQAAAFGLDNCQHLA
ncbi:hypothetical protein D3C71_2096780 [compost metagenome]